MRVREAIVKGWLGSRLRDLRMLAKAIVLTAHKANAVSSPAFRTLSGYTDAPADYAPGPGDDAFDFVQFEAGAGVAQVETDVVIVGSGCGGAVCAKNLAEAGHGVVVVDKGYYFPPSQLPMTQPAACQYLYDHGGVHMTKNASAGIVCGSSWGGGGAINWSVCFRLQRFVRDEWAARGLPLFASGAYDACEARVWERIGASTAGIRHNHGNRALLDGAARLGWRAAAVEQNTGGREHACGRCHLGCGSGDKRGPGVAWLPAAGAAGAEFIEGLDVARVTFAADGVTATGVEGTWTARGPGGAVHTPLGARTRRAVRIRAKRVIVSAGSLWSPVLLEKSGVKVRWGHDGAGGGLAVR